MPSLWPKVIRKRKWSESTRYSPLRTLFASLVQGFLALFRRTGHSFNIPRDPDSCHRTHLGENRTGSGSKPDLTIL